MLKQIHSSTSSPKRLGDASMPLLQAEQSLGTLLLVVSNMHADTQQSTARLDWSVEQAVHAHYTLNQAAIRRWRSPKTASSMQAWWHQKIQHSLLHNEQPTTPARIGIEYGPASKLLSKLHKHSVWTFHKILTSRRGSWLAHLTTLVVVQSLTSSRS